MILKHFFPSLRSKYLQISNNMLWQDSRSADPQKEENESIFSKEKNNRWFYWQRARLLAFATTTFENFNWSWEQTNERKKSTVSRWVDALLGGNCNHGLNKLTANYWSLQDYFCAMCLAMEMKAGRREQSSIRFCLHCGNTALDGSRLCKSFKSIQRAIDLKGE